MSEDTKDDQPDWFEMTGTNPVYTGSVIVKEYKQPTRRQVRRILIMWRIERFARWVIRRPYIDE